MVLDDEGRRFWESFTGWKKKGSRGQDQVQEERVTYLKKDPEEWGLLKWGNYISGVSMVLLSDFYNTKVR